MTLEFPAPPANPPQSIEPLTEIYDGVDVIVYRFDASQALMRMGLGNATSVVVLTPWYWTDPAPMHQAYRGGLMPQDYSRVSGWLLERPGATAEMFFESLLGWSCRRALLSHRSKSERGYQEDPQRIGPAVFNRFLLREALQTWVQIGVRPGTTMKLEATRTKAGPALRISQGATRALIGAMIETEGGDDPLLPDWPEDAFAPAAEASRG